MRVTAPDHIDAAAGEDFEPDTSPDESATVSRRSIRFIGYLESLDRATGALPDPNRRKTVRAAGAAAYGASM
jgi:hypothetical protein